MRRPQPIAVDEHRERGWQQARDIDRHQHPGTGIRDLRAELVGGVERVHLPRLGRPLPVDVAVVVLVTVANWLRQRRQGRGERRQGSRRVDRGHDRRVLGRVLGRRGIGVDRAVLQRALELAVGVLLQRDLVVVGAENLAGGDIGQERHEKVEQTFVAVSGRGRVLLEGEERPFAPGGEIAGVVEALGEGVEGWKPGDRLIVTAGVPFGTPGATNILRVAWVGD